MNEAKVEEIRQRADIVDVIGAHVVLKKKGQRYSGLCPFHGEKTPSFSVSRDKGLFYCFGCHAKGDVFSFVQRYEGLDFPAAARKLAERFGVVLEQESPELVAKKKSEAELVRVNEFALAFFTHQLWTERGLEGRRYLASRKIPEDFAKERKLGFGGAPGELLQYLDAKRVPRALAAKAGLLTDDGDRSLFDQRLIFPIHDLLGRLVGFGGRRLGEGSAPKYVNTRESPLFKKRMLLYGWDLAQHAVRRAKRVIIVEGYTDVLACQRAGFDEAVAALGTAFTSDHAALCARTATDAIVVLDADPAGERASRDVTERLLRAKLKVFFAVLPKGEDPDSVVRTRGVEALRRPIHGAGPAIETFMTQAFAKPNLSVEDKAKAATELAPLLAALGEGLERDLYFARLAGLVGVPRERLEQHLAPALAEATRLAQRALQRSHEREKPPSAAGTTSSAEGASPGSAGERGDTTPSAAGLPTPAAPRRAQQPHASEIELLAELLLFPNLRPKFVDFIDYATEPLHELLTLLAGGEEDAAILAQRAGLEPKLVARLSRVPTVATLQDPEVEERAKRSFQDVLSRFKGRYLEGRLREKKQELAERAARGEDTQELMNEVRDLTRHTRRLKRAGSSTS